jgi:hypothetical protein
LNSNIRHQTDDIKCNVVAADLSTAAPENDSAGEDPHFLAVDIACCWLYGTSTTFVDGFVLSGRAAWQAVVPLWIYWSYICVEFHQGAMILPSSLNWVEVKRFWAQDIVAPVWDYAAPSPRAAIFYLAWHLWQALLAVYLPGPVGEGLPLADGTRLKYKYNGHLAFAITNLVAGLCHYTAIFRLTDLYDLFPQLLTLSLMSTSLVCAALYICATERATNSVVYNYFMGCDLVPPAPLSHPLSFIFALITQTSCFAFFRRILVSVTLTLSSSLRPVLE